MRVDIVDKKVVVLGLGLTGRSCVHFLLKHGANVVAMDSREDIANDLAVPVLLGEYDADILCKAELVLLSPGIDPMHPAIQKAINAGIEIIGDVELFARFNEKPVIAITGSNGKSTVTSLVFEMLKASGKRVQMGGNIGLPVLELIEQDADYLVLELSSFQLETVSSLQPVVATILNITEDHIDRHRSLSAYQQAKQRIYHNAEQKIVNRDDPLTLVDGQCDCLSFGLSASNKGFSWDNESETILFDGTAYLKQSDCLLTGSHNMLNIAAAAACAKAIGTADSAIINAARHFSGLAHRFETISNFNNVRWINDSKATNVGATIAAIMSFSSHKTGKLILIAGGDGKNADFSPLQQPLAEYVDFLITFGQDGGQIASLLADNAAASNLKHAVELANQQANAGDVVLLSPACASLDMFNNYQHRGACFTQAVKELAA